MAPAEPFLVLELVDEAATATLAGDVAACLAPGDLIALSGGLGVGKTTFARAVIRAIAADPAVEVPSPTFTLLEVYSGGPTTIAHVDLFRLSDSRELDEIGLTDLLTECAALVEWPERAAERLPDDRLDIAIEIVGAGRRASLSGGEGWRERIGRTRVARDFLARAGWPAAARRRIRGDASTRRHERIVADGRSTVLMDWPRRDPAPFKDARGRYRARDVRAFVAVDQALRGAGLSAPEIYATDLSAGFVLMEDLGAEPVIDDGRPIAARYRLAVDVLAAIHAKPRPASLSGPDGTERRLPELAGEALAPEIGLFVDWYMPYATGEPLAEREQRTLATLWSPLFDRLAGFEKSWVLFDVQSANLLWLAGRQGLRRLGLLDFQDMFFGPSAYDVASLCQDARVTVPTSLETELRAHYVARRRATYPDFDADAFDTAYAVLGTVRAFKNLGVFARQAVHLGRRRYLQHIPRVREYLVRNFAHPVLSDLAVWYDEHVDRKQAAR